MNKFFVVLAIAIAAASCKSLRFLEAESMRNLVDIQGACNIVSAVSDTYKKVVDAFKSGVQSSIVKTITKDGFVKFAGSGKTKVLKGIKEETGWDKFKKNTLKNMKLPQKYVDEVEALLDEAEYSEGGAWNQFDMLFDVNSVKDTCKYCSIVVNHREEDEKFDVVYSDIQADFKLAPEIQVIHKSKSILGGIFSSEKDVEKIVPKNLTQNDLFMIFSFFQIISYKLILQQFGVIVNFPKI